MSNLKSLLPEVQKLYPKATIEERMFRNNIYCDFFAIWETGTDSFAISFDCSIIVPHLQALTGDQVLLIISKIWVSSGLIIIYPR